MSGSRSCSSSADSATPEALAAAEPTPGPRGLPAYAWPCQTPRRARPLRRRAARVLRRPGGTRRGRALPPPRHRRARHPRRAARRRSASTTSPAAGAARSTTSTATCWCGCGPSSTGAGSTRRSLWGNRNSEPFFADALREALDLGAPRVVTLLTSAYSCYSSCRQYREDLAAAVEEVGPAADGLVVDKVRPYAVHPGPRPRLAASARRGGARAARPGIRAPALRHPLGARGDGRHLRPGGRRGQPLRRPAPAPVPPPHRRGQRRAGPASSRASWCSARARGHRRSRGSSPTSTTASRSSPPGRGHRRVCADRVRLRPHGGRPRPRHRGGRDGRRGSGSPSCGWRPPARTTCSSRAWSTSSSSGPPRPAARWSSPDLAPR